MRWAAALWLVGCGTGARGGEPVVPMPGDPVEVEDGEQGRAASAPGTLTTVAELSLAPGNLTVTPAGRVILSLHQFYEPPMTVARLGEGGRLEPFAQDAELDSVLGLQSDSQGVVWMLDNGMRSGTTPKLVAWDTARDRLKTSIDLGPVTVEGSFVNDLAVDEDHGAIYIADPANGDDAALIVVSLSDGTPRRVMSGHPSVVPEQVDLVVDGQPVRVRTPAGEVVRPHIGVNPIATSADNEHLYYGPMHGRSMYRVPTEALRDASLSQDALSARVERWADKPICDGISLDREGNLYLGDLERMAIGVIDEDRRYRVLVDDRRLQWPDAFAFGPEGQLFTVANQLHRSDRLSAGRGSAEPPFLVLRVVPLAPGTTGR